MNQPMIFTDPFATVMAVLLDARYHKSTPPTPEQLEERRRAEERAAWNREVEARRAAKKTKKGAKP